MKKYRNEWKYCCLESQLKLLDCRLKNLLKLDSNSGSNGKYVVHSLYFDDFKDRCAKENEAGDFKRFKWRIRYYDNSYESIHLEYKEKLFGMCYKKSCPITKDEYSKLLVCDVLDIFWNTDKDLLKKFCIDIMNKNFTPKVIIDYERRAYIDLNTNIRITLDTNISAAYNFEKFLSNDYAKYPLQDKNYHILEVKFDDILPGYIKNIVSSYNFIQISFSKYYLGRKKLEEVLR